MIGKVLNSVVQPPQDPQQGGHLLYDVVETPERDARQEQRHWAQVLCHAQRSQRPMADACKQKASQFDQVRWLVRTDCQRLQQICRKAIVFSSCLACSKAAAPWI